MVSWLPFYHDMGLILGVCAPILRDSRSAHESGVVPAASGPVDAIAGNQFRAFSAAPNFAFELAARKTSDDDMAGLDLGACNHHQGSERVDPATLSRFDERFARFNLRDTVVRPSYGLAEATVYVASSTAGSTTTIGRLPVRPNFPPATRSGAQAEAAHHWSVIRCRKQYVVEAYITRPLLRPRPEVDVRVKIGEPVSHNQIIAEIRSTQPHGLDEIRGVVERALVVSRVRDYHEDPLLGITRFGRLAGQPRRPPSRTRRRR